MIYTDDARAYKGLPNHEAVKHSVSEYVRDQVHTNGIESFWSLLKRGHQGIYHKMSPKHLDRYVREYSHRHNVRECDTIDQMNSLAAGMRLKRLRYKDLICGQRIGFGRKGGLMGKPPAGRGKRRPGVREMPVPPSDYQPLRDELEEVTDNAEAVPQSRPEGVFPSIPIHQEAIRLTFPPIRGDNLDC